MHVDGAILMPPLFFLTHNLVLLNRGRGARLSCVHYIAATNNFRLVAILFASVISGVGALTMYRLMVLTVSVVYQANKHRARPPSSRL